jgi:hypothetical protein
MSKTPEELLEEAEIVLDSGAHTTCCELVHELVLALREALHDRNSALALLKWKKFFDEEDAMTAVEATSPP